LDRRAKVELFEQIRREYEYGEGTINGVARKLGIHRRMVREALAKLAVAYTAVHEAAHLYIAMPSLF
jgi:hypothetical protein